MTTIVAGEVAEDAFVAKNARKASHPITTTQPYHRYLGRVDKMGLHGGLVMIQAGICYGDQLAPRPDER